MHFAQLTPSSFVYDEQVFNPFSTSFASYKDFSRELSAHENLKSSPFVRSDGDFKHESILSEANESRLNHKLHHLDVVVGRAFDEHRKTRVVNNFLSSFDCHSRSLIWKFEEINVNQNEMRNFRRQSCEQTQRIFFNQTIVFHLLEKLVSGKS